MACGILRIRIHCTSMVCWMSFKIHGLMGTTTLHTEAHLYYRFDCRRGVHGSFVRWIKWSGICNECHTWNTLPANSTYATCGSSRWHMASPRFRCLHSPSRIDYHAVHWIPRTHIQFVLCVSRRERCNQP
uniref:Putative kvlqt1 voltage-gated delayed rectifier potassium channel n=1 Tax=Nyssomyia neivai TaxID=330878 RepID=A0A1L8DF79_9DIPT